MLFAAIPYFQIPVVYVPLPGTFELPIDPWATMVCIGFIAGLEVARYRAIKLGLDVRDIVDGSVVTVLSGFFFAHIFTVFFYYPERMKFREMKLALDNGATQDFFSFGYEGFMSLVRVWEGFASTGGFIGAVIGSALFYLAYRKVGYWRHADCITYGFPIGWFFGRVGCGVVHDHIGSKTDFFLAMDFGEKMGIRHELGLYEAAYMVVVSAVFLYLGKKDRPPGFFLASFAVAYAPLRFVLDFLRNSDLSAPDARYFGLTPAQYGMIIMFFAGIWVIYRLKKVEFAPWPMDGKPNQEERALQPAKEQ
ncbi:MAG: hypothetical protein HN348_10075 [Proteobacteria bacterium]|jgi:phosphatidylglycerol---prolipoprotein diacylglyceryl transferase|nr:hypothetical protein [Pseudomonadota bacterium]